MCDGYFIRQLKILTPAAVASLLSKGGSVRVPPAVSQGVQTLQASNLSAQTHTAIRIFFLKTTTSLSVQKGYKELM